MRHLAALFSTPGRQAAAWAALGVAGVILAATGLLIGLTGEPGTSGRPAGSARAVATATATQPSVVRPSPSASPSRTPSPAASPSTAATGTPPPSATGTSTPTTVPRADDPPAAVPTATRTPTPTATASPIPTPTPTPTPEPLVYCPGGGSGSEVRIFGLVTVGGQSAPAGTSVTVVLGGVAGPSTVVELADGRSGYGLWFAVDESPGCANRSGAPIGLSVDGRFVATGLAIGTGTPINFPLAIP